MRVEFFCKGEKQMYSKKIKFTDFDGNQREETHYFNFTKAELVELQTSKLGGLDKALKRIIEAKNTPEIVATIKMVIAKAYGVKSDDGRRFIKSPEIFAEFEQTEAYSELFMLLSSNDEEAAKFFNGLIPKDLAEQVQKEVAKQNVANI